MPTPPLYETTNRRTDPIFQLPDTECKVISVGVNPFHIRHRVSTSPRVLWNFRPRSGRDPLVTRKRSFKGKWRVRRQGPRSNDLIFTFLPSVAVSINTPGGRYATDRPVPGPDCCPRTETSTLTRTTTPEEGVLDGKEDSDVSRVFRVGQGHPSSPCLCPMPRSVRSK